MKNVTKESPLKKITPNQPNNNNNDKLQTKNLSCSKAAPDFLSLLGGYRGLALMVSVWNPAANLGLVHHCWRGSSLSWKHSDSFKTFFMTERLWPGGMGGLWTPNQNSSFFHSHPDVGPPSWLWLFSQVAVILFSEEVSGPGGGLGARLRSEEQLWEGGGEGWHSQVRREVSGFPRSTGHHRSWYSKCLLHCTSLWKKIVCWKVSKQTLY